MKYILGLFHSLRLSYIGRFGGKIPEGTYYLWWTIHVYAKSLVIENVHIFTLRELKCIFYIHKVNNVVSSGNSYDKI